MTEQLSRRALLAGVSLAGLAGLAGCASTADRPSASQTGVVTTEQPLAERHAYGADASQFGELYRPAGAQQRGTIVVLHGGFWRSEYDLSLGTSLAQDLAARGWTTWNLEYRRVGNGGGWPATLADVAAGIDLLADLRVDTSKVVAIGHSAGGQLATWAAGRGKLPAGAPGADPKVALTGVVSQAGVMDLVTAANQMVGSTAVPDLLGGSPAKVPQRYRQASPQAQLPLAVPVRCVHSPADANVPFLQSTGYVAAAQAAGADAELVQVTGDHFALISTGSSAWRAVLTLLPGLFG